MLYDIDLQLKITDDEFSALYEWATDKAEGDGQQT